MGENSSHFSFFCSYTIQCDDGDNDDDVKNRILHTTSGLLFLIYETHYL